MEREKVAIIGAGVIGGAIACAISDDFQVTATRRKIERLSPLAERGINITSDNDKAVSEAEVIIISVKPYQVIPLLKNLSHGLKDRLLTSSVAFVLISKKTQPPKGAESFLRELKEDLTAKFGF